MRTLFIAAGVSASIAASLMAQAPVVAPDASRHIDAARAAAGPDWKNLVDSVCNSAVALARPAAPRGGGTSAAPGAGAPRATPARDTWAAEPQRVFDNLYYVGEKDYSAWAIATSQGIIVLDAIFDYSVKDQIEGGLRTVGLNPADIKYVVVSHGHLDHAGGAKYLQETYGARLIMGEADYVLMDRTNPSWKPKRDMVATDGMQLALGDLTLTMYLTPGHTEGTLSVVFPVRDGTSRHMVGTWGGTSFNFGPIRARVASYLEQAERMRSIVEKANVDVILSNHPGNDGTHARIAALRTRKPGERHPFVVGNAAVQRYYVAAAHCARAALAILPS